MPDTPPAVPAEAVSAQVSADLVREILVAVCERDGLSLDSAAEPGEPARNYELALRLGIGRIFGLTGGDPADRERQEALAAFLDASVAVWREIDRLDAEPDGYHPVRMSVDLRKTERAAWERYRDLIGGGH